VIRVPIDVFAAERARWLAELAQVLEQAQELMSRLAVADRRRGEVLDVSARLEAARAEVQALRRARLSEPPENLDPEWPRQLPWDRHWPERRA
jgi:hypothetical protein